MISIVNVHISANIFDALVSINKFRDFCELFREDNVINVLKGSEAVYFLENLRSRGRGTFYDNARFLFITFKPLGFFIQILCVLLIFYVEMEKI